MTFTVFPDVKARSKREVTWSLWRLERELKATTAPTKDDLPLFTGVMFGDRKDPDSGSFRTNGNAEAMAAIVVDYDDGEITPKEAADLCWRANLQALVASTSSHGQPGRGNCWRAIFRLSKTKSLDDHGDLVARANGLFDGALDRASFTVSQSYYFGHVGRIETYLVEGRQFLDQADDLDAGAIGRPRPRESGKGGTGEKTGYSLDEFRSAVLAIPNDDKPYDEWLAIVMAIHDETDGSDEGLELAGEWSARSAKYDSGDLERRWDSFGRNGGVRKTGRSIIREARKLGWEDPRIQDAVDDMPENTDDDTPIDPVTARLNERHAVVWHAGRTLVATFGRDGSTDLGSVEDLNKWHANDLVRGKPGKPKEPASARWLRDPDRRQYRGIIFDPSDRASPAALNLWTGLAVKPNPRGSCDRIVEHVRDVVCGCKPKRFAYVIGWLSDIVQNPGRKPGVALVLKGGKGAGKDTLAEVLRRIIGQRHVAHVDSPDRLTNRFNAAFATAILVHVEEGYWAGDRAKRGTLQALITSPTMPLERKGIDVVEVDSFVRLIMTTNEDRAVPASADERRYAVFDVSDSRIGDADYFDALYAEIEGDGPAAFLAYLLDVDLSAFDVRAVPQTAALRDQKLASLSGVARWWFGVLERGQLPGDSGDWSRTGADVASDALRESYEGFVRDNRFQGEAVTANQFGIELRRLLPSVERLRPRPKAGARIRVYGMPDLNQSRFEFERWLGSAVEW